MRLVVFFLVSVLPFLASPTHPALAASGAPPATPSTVIRNLATRIDVAPDGKFRTSTELTVALSDASAVERWGSLSLPYQVEVEEVRLTDLRVTKADGRERRLEIPASEDATLSGAFDGPVYTDIHVRHFTIPSLEAGDVLHYRIEEERRTPLAPGHFWTEHRFTRDAVVDDETLELLLPAGRRFIVKVRDGADIETVPFAVPDGRQAYRWRHRQTTVPEPTEAEVAARTAQFVRGRVLDPADVQVTSFPDWKAVAAWYSGLARTQADADDAVKRQAETLTAGLTTERERLAALHRFVSQSVRYVSLAFGIGRYQPRAASLVLSTQYGDCKDKHTLLEAMAASKGIRAEPVLIASQRTLDPDVPSPAQFDHVITRAQLADGEALWIDGTNPYAPPGVLTAAISDKQALGIGAGVPFLLRTPAARRTSLHRNITGAITDDGRVTLHVRVTAEGDGDIGLRAAFDKVPDADLAKAFQRAPSAYGLKKENLKAARKADARNLAEPFWLALDFEFPISFDAKQPWTFWLPTERLDIPDVPKGATTDLDLAAWNDQHLRAFVEVPAGFSVSPPLPVSVTREVASYSSIYTVAKGSIALERHLQVLLPSLAPSAFDGFAALERAVEADYKQEFTIQPYAGTVPARRSDADRLTSDAVRKIEAREYVEAEKLLRGVLELEPDHKTAWLQLGRALHGRGRYEEAIQAYDRQIALNAFDEWAWNNRGWSEWSAKRLDAADASFRKQIQIDPLHKTAHVNLGNLLVERKRWPEARAVLETAARLQPGNGHVHLQLAKAMVATGAEADALPIFDKAVTLSKSPWAWNDAAWYLVEHGLDLDRALAYARSAVSGATAASNGPVSESTKPSARVGRTLSLAAYWDTLGWIQFKRGETAEAVRYLSSAWQVHQNAEVGEHLGRALERAGRRREALLTYKAALSLPKGSDSLAAAARALAKNPPPGQWATDGATLARQAHGHSIARPGVRVGTGDVFLAIDESGRIVEAREVEDDVFGEPVPDLVGSRLSVKAPDQSPLRIEVLATLTCPSRGAMCTLALGTADEPTN
jgi:tetratricopeptide (TPR) repeat protein/transglutaminase-like putative cysteine protease